MRKTLIGLAFASPWVIGLLLFTMYPMIMSLYYSFTDYNILNPPRWIGIQNYSNLIQDDLFWTSIYNTIYITLLGVPLSILLGLGAAILLNQKVRGLGLFRTLFFVPTIVPPVAVGIVWIFILNPEYGILNAILSFLHLPEPGWLADPSFSKLGLLFMALWQSGQVIVILLAGLQDVPTSLYEAADIDGAGEFRKFRVITLPLLSPIIFFNVVIGIVNFLQFFTQAFVASRNDLGGPTHSTLFYTIYMYQNGFQFFKMGYASAMAWGLFLITLIITLLVFGIGRKAVHYGGE